jgi:hypothetical protein
MEQSTQISLQNLRLQNFRCFGQLESTMGYEDCLSPASNFVQVQQWIAKATYAQVQESTAAIKTA